jgi:hypothetical protein
MADTVDVERVEAVPHSPRQVLLGLFILFQLVFLILTNVLTMLTWGPEAEDKQRKLLNRVAPLEDKSRHFWSWSEELHTHLQCWAQLTGQDQPWTLFAPGVYRTSGFPVVILHFDESLPETPGLPDAMLAFDAANGYHVCPRPPQASPAIVGAVGFLGVNGCLDAISLFAAHQLRLSDGAPRVIVLPSDNEPANIHDYVRFGNIRVRRYEGQFHVFAIPNGMVEEDFAIRLTNDVRNLVTNYEAPVLQYLKWKRDTWIQERRGESPPRQIVLMHRYYRILEPGNARRWDGPFLVPIARWTPDDRPDARQLLEYYNFNEHRFTAIVR